MYKRRLVNFISIITVITMCSTVVFAVAAEPSSTKFLSRISRKSELLSRMNQSAGELKEICAAVKCNKPDVKDTESFQGKSRSPEDTDLKYLTRLEGKLNILVNDTLNDTITPNKIAFRPMMAGNLLPESRFDSVDMQKELQEEDLDVIDMRKE